MATTSTHTALSRRVAIACREAGIPMYRVAQQLGIGHNLFYEWGAGPDAVPRSIRNLVAVADYLGVSTDWLLGRTNERRPA